MWFLLAPLAYAVDADGDGYSPTTGLARDCNDMPMAGGAGINPAATEIVGDGIDQDCDNRDGVKRWFALSKFASSRSAGVSPRAVSPAS